VDTARKLMSDLHMAWLRKSGNTVPGGDRVLEISPLLAADGEDLRRPIDIPDREKVYLDRGDTTA